VAESSGDKAFERASITAMEDSTFEPAKFNGQPVDGSLSLKTVFTQSRQPSKGAHPRFLTAYRELGKAIEAKDRIQADAAISKMIVINLYEDAFSNLGKAAYLSVWGTPREQLDALKRAVAHEKCPSYLPKAQFESALENLLRLQVQLNDFGGALATFKTMQGSCIDQKYSALWNPAVDQLQSLRHDRRSFTVEGVLSDSPWHLRLLKRNFRAVVSSGRISQIKLRCEKKYVFFQFDPQLLYRVAEDAGECSLELVGDPETTFALTQS
jgi:hypothetical protein